MNTLRLWWLLGISILVSVVVFGCVGADADVDAEVLVEDAFIVRGTGAFDGSLWNTSIGMGGGAAGKYGTRGGRLGRLRINPGLHTSGESYSAVKENAFKLVATAPLSTFGADVDTASYSNIRRYLNYGQLPPAAVVRVEEGLPANLSPLDGRYLPRTRSNGRPAWEMTGDGAASSCGIRALGGECGSPASCTFYHYKHYDDPWRAA